MKTLIFLIMTIVFYFITTQISETQYLNPNNITDIPLPNYSNSVGNVLFDLSEINATNNFLDLGIAMNIGSSGNFFTQGTWNENNLNGGFNNWNQYHNEAGSHSTVTPGIVFCQLRPNQKKDIVLGVGGSGGDIYVYHNDNNQINSTASQIIGLPFNYRFITTGNFNMEDNSNDIVAADGTEFAIYKNRFDASGTLDPSYLLFNLQNELQGVRMAEINEKYPPYLPNDPGNREDLVFSTFDNNGVWRIEIYRNDNQNGIVPFQSFSPINGGIIDFQVADLDEDGYNDLIVSGLDNNSVAHVYLYRNVQGQFFTPWLTFDNNNFIGPNTRIAVVDFNKDGWNDLAFISNGGLTSIFINKKTVPVFDVSNPDQLFSNYIPSNSQPSLVKAADIYNVGGNALLLSYILPKNPGPGYGMKVINAVTPWDIFPPPPILVGTLEQYGPNLYHPKLIMGSRGERDFFQYHIWKSSPSTNNQLIEIGQTIANEYTDNTECVLIGGDSPNWNCYYQVKMEDVSNHVSDYSSPAHYTVNCQLTCDGCEGSGKPGNNNTENFKLYQLANYPNPFNPVSKISYTIPYRSLVKLTVYDILGRIVKELVNEYKDRGKYSIDFDGKDLSSGIYLYRLETNNYVVTKKMLLIK